MVKKLLGGIFKNFQIIYSTKESWKKEFRKCRRNKDHPKYVSELEKQRETDWRVYKGSLAGRKYS